MNTGYLLPLLVAAVVADTRCQEWSMEASAPVLGTVSSSFHLGPSQSYSQTQTLAVGAVASQGISLTSAPHPAVDAAVVWSPMIGGSEAPLAWTSRVSNRCNTQGYGVVAAASSADVVLDVVLRSPQQIQGELVLTGTAFGSSTGLSFCQIRADVGADGTEEFHLLAPLTSVSQVRVPVQLTPQGLVVRVTHIGSAMPVWNAPGLRLDAKFLPSEPYVQEFRTAGAGTELSFTQAPGQVTVALTTPTHMPLLIATGLQPTQLQLLPSVTQLVTLDGTYLTGSLTLPLPVLPPGFEIYCQGLAIDSTMTLRSSRSLRAVWP